MASCIGTSQKMLISHLAEKECNSVQEIVRYIETKVTTSPAPPPKPSDIVSLSLTRPSVVKCKLSSPSSREDTCSDTVVEDNPQAVVDVDNMQVTELMDIIFSQNQLLENFKADSTVRREEIDREHQEQESVISSLMAQLESARLQLQEKDASLRSLQDNAESMAIELGRRKTETDDMVSGLTIEIETLRSMLDAECTKTLGSASEIEELKRLHDSTVSSLDGQMLSLQSELESLKLQLASQAVTLSTSCEERDSVVAALSAQLSAAQTDLAVAQQRALDAGEVVTRQETEIMELNRSKLALLEWIRMSCEEDSAPHIALGTLISSLYPQSAANIGFPFPSE